MKWFGLHGNENKPKIVAEYGRHELSYLLPTSKSHLPVILGVFSFGHGVLVVAETENSRFSLLCAAAALEHLS